MRKMEEKIEEWLETKKMGERAGADPSVAERQRPLPLEF